MKYILLIFILLSFCFSGHDGRNRVDSVFNIKILGNDSIFYDTSFIYFDWSPVKKRLITPNTESEKPYNLKRKKIN